MIPKQLLKFYLVSLVLVLVYNNCFSQNLVSDSSTPGYKNAVAFYNQSLARELHLFNGRENRPYTHKFRTGTPYFLTDNWSKGSIDYDGKLYENVSLMYDVARDEVVYLYFDEMSSIQIEKEKVSAFSVMGHHFIHITPDSLGSMVPGFYDELYNGKLSLLVRRTKNIQEFLNQSGEEFEVFSKDHYFIKKRNEYFPVSSKRSFLNNLSDKKKELQQYIRRNKFSFKKDIENAMTKSLAYYDQLINM